MAGDRDLLPLIAAEAALRLGLAKPWEAAAALQSVWDAKSGTEIAFETELARFAKLSRDAVQSLRADIAKSLEEAGGDVTRVLARPRPGGSILVLRSIAAGGPAGVTSALGDRDDLTGPPLHTVSESRYVEFHAAGEGGMGIVYWALDTEMNRQVAFKIVRPDAVAEALSSAPATPIHASPPTRDTPASAAFEQLKARFLQEAWVTGGLEHPGIVPVYEMGLTPEGIPYYTMRFVRGQRTLAAAIEDVRGAPLEQRLELLEPFLKVCDTVAYAHSRGVIHRDLKPENIALGEFGEVVVLDWGLARLRDGQDVARDRWQERVNAYRKTADLNTAVSLVGTPGYMAPEAARGDVSAIDQRSDVYSLGAILFRILTGRLPHEFETFTEFLEKTVGWDAPPAATVDAIVPQPLSDRCALALARDPTLRTSSAAALASGIRAWQKANSAEREAEAVLREARTALAAAETASGEARLRILDGGAASCARALALVPDHAGARECARIVESSRLQASQEVVRDARRRTRRRAATVIAVLGLAASGAFVAHSEAARARTEAALRRARALGLVSASREASAISSTRAFLLAREALRLEARPETISALQEALVAPYETAQFPSPKSIRSAVLSPDGKLVLAACGEGTGRLWDVRGHELAVLRGHESGVVSVAFSPDSTRLATASLDRTARLWDTGGRELAVLRGHAEAVVSTAFSPHGARVLTASRDGTARVWDDLGKETALLRGHEAALDVAVFSPDGRRILTASRDKTARLWDVEGRETAVLRGHDGTIVDASFSPDGARVLTASRDGTARIWDLEGRELLLIRRDGDDLSEGLQRAVFSPDGKRVLTASIHGIALLWDVPDGLGTSERRILGREVAALRGHEGSLLGAAFSPDGKRIVTTAIDSTARLWAVPTSEPGFPAFEMAEAEVIAILRGHGSDVLSAAFSQDGEQILTVAMDRTARMWRLFPEEVTLLRGHQAGVTGAAFSPDGRLILTSSWDKTARLWDRAGKEVLTLRGHDGGVVAASLSPDGTRILTASHDKTARIWARSGLEIAVLRGHEAAVESAEFSHDGARIVTASRDGSVRLWDAAGRETATHRLGQATCAVFSPDGEQILVALNDGTAQLCDLAGKPRGTLRGHEGSLLGVSFSTDGKRVLTASTDGTARVWDLEGRELLVLRGHDHVVYSAILSRDGQRVLSASGDATVRLWDLAGRQVAVLRGHNEHVRSAHFSPDGRWIVSAAGDTARIWLAREDDLRRAADERPVRHFTDDERDRYRDLLLPRQQ